MRLVVLRVKYLMVAIKARLIPHKLLDHLGFTVVQGKGTRPKTRPKLPNLGSTLPQVHDHHHD